MKFFNRSTRKPLSDSFFSKEDMCDAYNAAMKTVQEAMTGSLDSRSDVIRLLMKTLKIDLFGSGLTRILLCKTNETLQWHYDFIPHFPFPDGYKPERRNEMPVGDNTVVSVPWDIQRWGKAIHDLTLGDFEYHANNHTGDFFPELQLIKVTNGRHHLALAHLKKQGKLDVYVYPLTLCFPYFTTNGAYWYNEKTSNKTPVKEIRFAILYGLARELWKEDVATNK